MTEFEVKYFNKAHWEKVPDKIVMERLLDSLPLVTPVITEMMKGKYAYTPHVVYRMKLNGEDIR